MYAPPKYSEQGVAGLVQRTQAAAWANATVSEWYPETYAQCVGETHGSHLASRWKQAHQREYMDAYARGWRDRNRVCCAIFNDIRDLYATPPDAKQFHADFKAVYLAKLNKPLPLLPPVYHVPDRTSCCALQ
jgi:hypothetical protein